MEENLNSILTRLGVAPTLMPTPDTQIANLTYGDLERIIKFVVQTNPVRWYDGQNFWKNPRVSLFNTYPALNVTNLMQPVQGRTFTLFPRLCARQDPIVLVLNTDIDDADHIRACIRYANANCINAGASVMINSRQCNFTVPPDQHNLQPLVNFFEDRIQGA